MNTHRIGKGKYMSIAKAALKVFYEEIYPTEKEAEEGFIDYGDLGPVHRIIDVAGARHRSFLTAEQVIACLRSSPYWKSRFCPGFYSGFRGHGGASLFTPSAKGKIFYLNYLRGGK